MDHGGACRLDSRIRRQTPNQRIGIMTFGQHPRLIGCFLLLIVEQEPEKLHRYGRKPQSIRKELRDDSSVHWRADISAGVSGMFVGIGPRLSLNM